MSEKSEKAKELFLSGHNCAQAVLAVFCEELGLDYDTAMKISSSFGGGMGRMKEVCGTVSAMFMAAGLAYNTKENDKQAQYKIVQELAQNFKDRNNTIICRDLAKVPCPKLVEDSVEIFEEYLKEHKPQVAVNQ
ncbi:C_GCAxxG_C_C family protein [bacterium]|jgi:C_GCAxxG_C_C family probable redox protein|nr:C_GCAxxG_C_C family protein [bacterium]